MSRAYITAQGDMWDSISHSQLGDAAHTDKLLSLNRHLLDYYIFPAGIAIQLPEAGADAPDVLPPWKQVAG